VLRFFGAAKTSRVLGIDISSTTVKLLELSRQGEGYRVESYAVAPLPPEAVIEKNIKQVETVGGVISDLVTRSKTHSTRAAAAVSGSAVIIKTVKMPAGLSEEDLEAQLTVEADQHIPYPLKEAVLKLDVTPNITPDDRILLDLVVNQDSVGELVPSGNGGLIPTIDTTELTTQVLVGNGETVVLGGVFKNEELVKVEKVPVLGDIPYLGNLFKSKANTQQKTETLIFITPRILSEALVN